MNDNFIKYSSPANLISLTIDKSYNITERNWRRTYESLDESRRIKKDNERLI